MTNLTACSGVAFSWTKKDVERPEYAEHPTLKGTFMGSRTLPRAALQWDAKNVLFQVLKLSDRKRRVTYESLMMDPEHELEPVLRLALEGRPTPHPAGSGGEGYEHRPFHTLGGNRVRFERGPIRLRADEEWRRAMAGSERKVVSALTFPLLVAYGYVGIPRRVRDST